MRKLLALADRTAVLFLGIAAGAAIGFAFGRSGEAPPARVTAAPAARPPGPPRPAAPAVAGFECALPFQQHLLDSVAANRPVTVGVFGDSFGDGVWSALYRLLPPQERFRVIKYSQESTGFTRYASLNLEDRAKAQLAADGPVDVAVISFGANDTQGVYSGGHAAALMSPEWQRVIGERVERFVRLMRSNGAMVYWVGLPKMRKVSFDDDIAAMNDFYAARMKALGVPFIDIKPLTVDGAGDYATYLPDPVSHEKRLLRANDGIHMSMNGYVVISRGLAGRIKTYVAAARTLATGAAPPVVVPQAPAGAVATGPEKKIERKQDRHEREKTSGEKQRPGGRAEHREHERADRPPRRHEDGEPGNASTTAPEADRDRPDRPTRHEPERRDHATNPAKRDGEGRAAPRGKADNESKPAVPARREDENGDRPSSKREGSDQPAASPKRNGEGKEKPAAPGKREGGDRDRPDSSDRHLNEGRDKPARSSGDARPRSGDAPAAKPRKRHDGDTSRSDGNSR